MTMTFKFHIVMHGTAVILVDRRVSSTEIVVPYDSCHCFIAANMQSDGTPIWQYDLLNQDHTITGITPPTIGAPITHPNNPDCLVCQFPGYGPNLWCVIRDLPSPKELMPWRRFGTGILDQRGSATYGSNGLGVVDNRAGIPSVYVLMYDDQPGPLYLNDGAKINNEIVPGSDNVARLHIYAESPHDDFHDALSTLNDCAKPNFDLKLKSGTTGLPAKTSLNDPTVLHWEQDALFERTTVKYTHEPPCYGMDTHPAEARPRTCIPIIGIVN
jgi:hypothetical protein